MALLRQRTERTHGNPRSTAPPTERCEKMMLTSDGEIVPMPMAEQEVFMQPVQVRKLYLKYWHQKFKKKIAMTMFFPTTLYSAIFKFPFSKFTRVMLRYFKVIKMTVS